MVRTQNNRNTTISLTFTFIHYRYDAVNGIPAAQKSAAFEKVGKHTSSFYVRVTFNNYYIITMHNTNAMLIVEAILWASILFLI